ncbi:MAG: glycosyltransferase family 2 protein [Clostridia bacterium]|nr:glycosyltransferase family 2 protein [Clostridia bacterium]
MKISVIMPSYNSIDTLESAVASVLSSQVPELELIIIDDASIDGSRELLSSLAERDCRIRAVYNEKNIGVGAVRNLGLKLATGELVAFCDSDDTVPTDGYANMLLDIGNNDIVIGGYRVLSDAGKCDTHIPRGRQKRELFYAVFSGSSLWHKMFRRSFILENSLSFREDVTLGEDVIFLSELLLCRPSFAVSAHSVYNYRNRREAKRSSLTHQFTLEKFREHIYCRTEMLRILEPAYPECRDYIYQHFVEYLDRFFALIPECERDEAFGEFRKYMSGYDYENHPELFLALTGVPYSVFCTASADTYLRAKEELLPRDRVSAEFAAGRIGLRFALKYIKNWLRFKLFGA